jgi:hypothetical protein
VTSSTEAAASISMQCPSCNARLRASRQLLGQICPCPRCRTRVTVRLALPSDSDVHLILDSEPTASRRR